MDAMRSGFDGLKADGTYVEVTELPADSNDAESKGLIYWKGDTQGLVD